MSVELNPLALEALENNQRQLDMDGVEVGVSRQALDELITAYKALATQPAREAQEPVAWRWREHYGLTAYWNEAAARERAKPPADKPTHAEVLQYGEAFATAPSDRAVWTIHDGSTGTFIGRWQMGHFFIEEAGDLWPSKPSHWLSRERAAEIAATRAPPQPAGDET